PAADGWIVLTLARPDDDELLPAWLGLGAVPSLEDRWHAVAAAVRDRDRADLVVAGVELGLAVGAVDRSAADVASDGVVVMSSGDGLPRSIDGALVVDLSSLWAGPLCGSILAMAGADVVKVESAQRPDGARRGPPGFFDLMNGAKRSVTVDLSSDGGRRALADLIARADVVIEASRPRALAQLGIDAEAVLAGRTTTWVSITGHGRSGDAALRIGFGDDAAASGGLVVWDEAGPCFCADAIADPITGLVAAVATLESLARPGAELLDVALSRVAATMAGPTVPIPEGVQLEAARPQTRVTNQRAPEPGTHNTQLLR
ncbi:MAG: CoA transferase, partial [Actinomycetota bacterium]|nr:CoA transferase [Actinomycetota bacterium]